MTVNDDKIRAKRAENKIKQSNIEKNLVNAREVRKNLYFWSKFAMTVNMKCKNDNKDVENKVK